MLRRDRVYAATHLSGRTEENLLIRSLLIPWEGRSLRFTIAFHLSEYMNTLAKDHELIYQEARANEAISVGMAEENPDRGIEKIIECISQNLKPERFLIFEERDDNTVSATYEWTAPGVMPLQDDLQSLSRTGVGALYRAFALYHVVLVSDIAAFKKENPDFSLPIYGIRSFVSGQLTLQGRTEGFTMVINPQEDTFRLASLLLSTLTDFIAIMIRNRNSMHMLEKQSMLDQMTGAGNRRMLEQTIGADSAGMRWGEVRLPDRRRRVCRGDGEYAGKGRADADSAHPRERGAKRHQSCSRLCVQQWEGMQF